LHGGRGVETALNAVREAIEGRAEGPRLVLRRHQPGSQLADDALPDFGVRPDMIRR
jgi:hypothetical protein